MSVQNVPSIWDFIGQGASNLGSSLTQEQARTDELKRQQLERDHQDAMMLAQMVASGQMDSATANANPVSAKMGLHFQPSPHELARKIVANPTLTPIIDTSKYTSLPGAMGVLSGVTGVEKGPGGTPDERALAGLPSVGAMTADDLAATVNPLRKKYISGGEVTDQQAAGLGVPTTGKIQADKRKELDPIITQAAERHVDDVFNGAGIDMTDPKAVRKNATVIANTAYDHWLTEASQNGSIQSVTPADREYAKTFFSQAVANAAKDADAAQLKLRVARAGHEDDASIRLYNALTGTADDYDRQLKEIRGTALGQIITMSKAEDLAKHPEWAATAHQIAQLQQQASTYRRNALKALTGKIDLSQIKGLDTVQPPSPVLPSGARSGAATTPDLRGMAAAIKSGTASMEHARQLLQAGAITKEDYDTLLKMVSAK